METCIVDMDFPIEEAFRKLKDGCFIRRKSFLDNHFWFMKDGEVKLFANGEIKKVDLSFAAPLDIDDWEEIEYQCIVCGDCIPIKNIGKEEYCSEKCYNEDLFSR